jgi:putative SOS response-associated peptidase YedK
MCGRYVSVQADSDLLAEFDAIDSTDGESPPADYNVAPTKPVRAIVNRPLRDGDGAVTGGAVRQLRVMRWGLIPSWAKDESIGARMINARAETVSTASAFRKAYAKRRCLIPADGWYEWRAGLDAKARKQPFFMTPSDGHGLAFAGLYEFWGERGATLTSCTIITAASAGDLSEIHNRMPLALPRSAWARWLDPAESDPADLLAPWDEARGEHLELRPVGLEVGNVANNGPELITAVHEAVQPQPLF